MKETKKEKVIVKKAYPFGKNISDECEIFEKVYYYCPKCGDRIMKNAAKCDIVSAEYTGGCRTYFDWSEVE